MAQKKVVRPITWIYDARHITDDYFENATRFHEVKGTTWRKLVGKRPQPLGGLLLRGIIEQLTTGYGMYKKP
jgi:hypothetical protein